MNQPEPVEIVESTAIPVAEEPEPATQEQDDLCHGTVGANVWYCSECGQYFDHPVKGPHPKPERTGKEKRTHLRVPLPAVFAKPPRVVQVGICQTCGQPFIGRDRCQCKVGKAQLVMVQAVRERGRKSA